MKSSSGIHFINDVSVIQVIILFGVFIFNIPIIFIINFLLSFYISEILGIIIFTLLMATNVLFFIGYEQYKILSNININSKVICYFGISGRVTTKPKWEFCRIEKINNRIIFKMRNGRIFKYYFKTDEEILIDFEDKQGKRENSVKN